MEFKTAGVAVAVWLVTRCERLCYTLLLLMVKNEKRMISWSTKKEKGILRHTSYRKHLVAKDWILCYRPRGWFSRWRSWINSCNPGSNFPTKTELGNAICFEKLTRHLSARFSPIASVYKCYAVALCAWLSSTRLQCACAGLRVHSNNVRPLSETLPLLQRH